MKKDQLAELRVGRANTALMTRLLQFEGELDAKPVQSAPELEQFIAELDKLKKAVISERGLSRYLTACDTQDAALKGRHEYCLKALLPKLERTEEKFRRRVLTSPSIEHLGSSYETFLRNIRNQSALFSEKNVDLSPELRVLENRTDELQSKLLIEWRGNRVPRQRLVPEQMSNDRAVREEAYRKVGEAKLSIAEETDAIFSQCVERREELAHNAGFDDYRRYRFLELKRFDYSPEESEAFCESVRIHMVPLWLKQIERRKRHRGLDRLRPWDIDCSTSGLAPIQVCEPTDFRAMKSLALSTIRSLDESLFQFAETLFEEGWVDMEPRANKFGGGFMTILPDVERTAICMNSNGLLKDFLTLVHELGHCFHYYLGKDIQPYEAQTWTNELAEVGSLSMEWFCLERLDGVLSGSDLDRARSERLEKVVRTFCMTAMLESFQHWVYKTPMASAGDRHERFFELLDTYFPGVDRTGLEKFEALGWQMPHVLRYPFYMIDYAIADMVAIHLWAESRKDMSRALRLYNKGCSLAGSRPLPELFEAFGVPFSLSDLAIRKTAATLDELTG